MVRVVSGQTIGTAGVGLGVLAIVVGFSDVGFGLLVIGVVGAIAIEGWNAAGRSEGKR